MVWLNICKGWPDYIVTKQHKLIAGDHLSSKVCSKIENEIEVSIKPKINQKLTVLWCISETNLQIISETGGEWWRWHIKFDFEGQDKSLPQIDRDINVVFCFSGSNLPILSWTDDKSSRGQAREWVWVIKFNDLSRTADSEAHIVHISRVIIACTLKSLSFPT